MDYYIAHLTKLWSAPAQIWYIYMQKTKKKQTPLLGGRQSYESFELQKILWYYWFRLFIACYPMHIFLEPTKKIDREPATLIVDIFTHVFMNLEKTL